MITSVHCAKNQFYGTWVAVNLFDATAGFGNEIWGNMAPYKGGSLFNGANAEGLILHQPQQGLNAVPGLPVSGVSVKNLTGRRVRVLYGDVRDGKVLGSIWRKRYETAMSGDISLSAADAIFLNPGDEIAPLYTGTLAAWDWIPQE